MNRRTLAQQRAAHALACIQNHIVRNKMAKKIDYGNYVSYVESLPATIAMNGLGQACANLLAKAEGKPDKPHGRLYDDLKGWLCRDDPIAPFSNAADLMQAICESDQKKYVHGQSEALAYLVWLKKFACAYLERGERE